MPKKNHEEIPVCPLCEDEGIAKLGCIEVSGVLYCEDHARELSSKRIKTIPGTTRNAFARTREPKPTYGKKS